MYKRQVLQLLTCRHLKSFIDSDHNDSFNWQVQLQSSSTGITTHAYIPLKAPFLSSKRGRDAVVISFGHS